MRTRYFFTLLFVIDGIIAVSALGGTIRLHDEGGTDDTKVTLSEIAELSGEDAAQLGHVEIVTLGDDAKQLEIRMADVRRALTAANINWASHELIGPEMCTVHLIRPAAPPAPAAELPAAVPNPEPEVEADQPLTVRDLVRQELAKQASIKSEDVKIISRHADDETLDAVVLGGNRSVKILAGRGETCTALIDQIGEDGRPETVRVPLRVGRIVKTAVALAPLRRGESIEPGTIGIRSTVVSLEGFKPIETAEAFVGQVASRNIDAGDVMSSEVVDAPIVVKRNEVVSVQARVGSLAIVQPMVARDNGAAGESIRVQRTDTREIVRVTVTGRRTATIDPPATPDPIFSEESF